MENSAGDDGEGRQVLRPGDRTLIAVVDYRMGNPASVLNMLSKLGIAAVRAASPDEAGNAEKLILPGVGAFDEGMCRLAEHGWIEFLTSRVLREKMPILGICLGLQLFSRGSEEGKNPGLGWLSADTVRIPAAPGIRIPHMGWNLARFTRPNPFAPSTPDPARFYFVHSFHVRCDDPGDVFMTTSYGSELTAAVQHENIVGVQFHPEKSHRFGMALLRQFALDGPC